MTSQFPSSRFDLFFEDDLHTNETSTHPLSHESGELGTGLVNATGEYSIDPLRLDTLFSALVFLSFVAWLLNQLLPSLTTSQSFRYIRDLDIYHKFRDYPEEVVMNLLEATPSSLLRRSGEFSSTDKVDTVDATDPPNFFVTASPSPEIWDPTSEPLQRGPPKIRGTKEVRPIYVRPVALDQLQNGLDFSLWSRAYDAGKFILLKLLDLLHQLFPNTFPSF